MEREQGFCVGSQHAWHGPSHQDFASEGINGILEIIDTLPRPARYLSCSYKQAQINFERLEREVYLLDGIGYYTP